MRKKIGILTAALLLVLTLSCVGQTRAGIPSDAYEPNDTAATARALGEGTHALTLGNIYDVDYFNISITQGYTLTVKATNPHTSPIYSLMILEGETTVKSTTINPSSSGSVSQVAAYTGNYTIRFNSTNSINGEYTLEISITLPGTGDDGVPGFDVFLVILSIFAGAGVLIASWKKRAILKS